MKASEKLNSFNLIKQPQDLLDLVHQHLNQSTELSAEQVPIIAVIGPTASGKTSFGISLAKAFNGEIISADSRQIYQGMDIGAATPSQEEQAQVIHHLINIREPDDLFSLADYQEFAVGLIENLKNRQKTPVIVGGTGLYISSITQKYQLSESKPNFILRRDLTSLADQQGKLAVHQQLEKLNPKVAANIHFNNLRYVIRAIEVETSQQQVETKQKDFIDRSKIIPYHTLYLTVEWDRAELYQRIENRIDQQIKTGLIEETKTLLSKYNPNLPALTSLGYQEIIEYINGVCSLEGAILKFKQHTRNFAKRQLTWIRRYSNVHSVLGPRLPEFIDFLNKSKPGNPKE